MGFMSWERFRCDIDCDAKPHACISESLYTSMADAMVAGGYVAAGYTRVDIDDCWSAMERDPVTQRLVPDPVRFPRGMRYLADYMHARGMLFGTYGDVGTHTCGGYPGSQGYEELDAQTLAEWGVDYLKLDGCYMEISDYRAYYTKWGDALKAVAAQQPIVFSCSWPAYLGKNETIKPFDQMYNEAGCNTWRNFADINNEWKSLKHIILHWAEYWKPLRDKLPVGAFHDADMLLVGDDHYGKVLTVDQARVQMGFWAIITSPLFIGGDVRTITEEYRRILLNTNIIAINQDAGRRMGSCIVGCPGADVASLAYSTPSDQQVWAKELNGGHSVALGFFNLDDDLNVPAVSAEYAFPAGTKIGKCLDLWAPGGTLVNLCPLEPTEVLPQRFVTPQWDLAIIQNASGAIQVYVTAKNMLAMTHEMLRIELLE